MCFPSDDVEAKATEKNEKKKEFSKIYGASHSKFMCCVGKHLLRLSDSREDGVHLESILIISHITRTSVFAIETLVCLS